jgi:hypothetical protein
MAERPSLKFGRWWGICCNGSLSPKADTPSRLMREDHWLAPGEGECRSVLRVRKLATSQTMPQERRASPMPAGGMSFEQREKDAPSNSIALPGG